MRRTKGAESMKNLMIGLCLFSGLFCLVNFAGAETLRLTLEEAIGLGIANSTTVQAKVLAVGSSKASVAGAKAAYYPVVSSNGTWSHLFMQPSTSLPGGSSYTAPNDPVSLSLDVNQTVYTFGKIKNAVRIGEKSLTLAEMNLKEETRKLAVDIRKAFYGYLLAKEFVRINEITIRFKEETLNVARKKYEAGIASDYEVLQAESDVTDFQPQLISSQNQVQFALLAVMDLLNVTSKEGFDVELVGALEPKFVTFDKQEMIKLALENKYDILNFRKTMEIAEVNSRIVAAANKPTVVAFGNYILTSGFDAESGKDKYWGQGSWTDTLTVAAAVQVPLSPLLPWSKERADVAKDKLDYEQMKLNLTTIESGVRLNIENLLLKIEEEKAKIHSREKSKELLSRLYRTTREGYTRGLVSNLELRDVETNLNNAALGYNLAVYNYTVAVILLYDAIGVDQQ